MQALWKACPHLSIPDAFPFACMPASAALSNAAGVSSDAAGVLSDAAGVLSSRQIVQIISILLLRQQRESKALLSVLHIQRHMRRCGLKDAKYQLAEIASSASDSASLTTHGQMRA